MPLQSARCSGDRSNSEHSLWLEQNRKHRLSSEKLFLILVCLRFTLLNPIEHILDRGFDLFVIHVELENLSLKLSIDRGPHFLQQLVEL
jgi:hypothetical protein